MWFIQEVKWLRHSNSPVHVIFKYFTRVELVANSNFGHLRPSLWVLGATLHPKIIPSWMGVLGEWSRLFYSPPSLDRLKNVLCVVWSTGKLQNSPEISWFAWVFLVVLCCVVYRHFTIEKMPELWWGSYHGYLSSNLSHFKKLTSHLSVTLVNFLLSSVFILHIYGLFFQCFTYSHLRMVFVTLHTSHT